MRVTPQFLDDVRARLPVSQVVNSKVKLKKVGHEWKGLCPFHNEKTPSFTVNDTKGFYHCFGCEEHGDQFHFVMKTEGLSFPETIEKLAGQAGLSIPQDDPQAVKREAHKLRLVEVLGAVQKYFHANLTSEVREYLTKRGINDNSISKFGIGWAGEKIGEIEVDGGRISPELLHSCGLIADGNHFRFANRIITPIKDRSGRVIGFGGRSDGSPKYLNSPETEVFHKGSILYNASEARQPAHDDEPLLVVEGYFDVIQCVQAGFPATVGTMGTALTQDNLRGLWQLSEVPIIAFDGDAAGQAATKKAIIQAFPLLVPGRSLKFITLPMGMDPEDMIRKRGKEALGRAVSGSMGLADTFYRITTEGRSTASPDDLASIEADLMEPIKTIPDKQLREKYARYCKDKISAIPKRRPGVVRSNGNTLHSTNPGALRLDHGISESTGFSLKEASMLIDLARSPLDVDPEKMDDRVSKRTRYVIGEMICLTGSLCGEALTAAYGKGRIGDALGEAREVLAGAGVSI